MRVDFFPVIIIIIVTIVIIAYYDIYFRSCPSFLSHFDFFSDHPFPETLLQR